MDEIRVKELKAKGNVCFGKSQWSEALKFYLEAIDLAKATNADEKDISILLSNSSQAHFHLDNFQQMFDAANESLHYDPDYKKSRLRRAIANFELGNLKDAGEEFKLLLKDEPKNLTVLRYVRRIHFPVKMHNALLRAHLSNYLRCVTIHAEVEYKEEVATFKGKFVNFLLRMIFLSAKNSTAMQSFLNNSRLLELYSNVCGLYLPYFFAIKRSKCCRFRTCYTLVKKFSNPALLLMFLLTRPVNLHLRFTLNATKIANAFSFHPFSSITYQCEQNLPSNIFAPQHHLNTIENSCKVLTRLPCYQGVAQLRNVTFPKINSVVVPQKNSVDKEFLKVWHERKWPVKFLIFHLNIPQLSAFENFNGIVSDALTKLSLPISDDVSTPLNLMPDSDIERFKKNMETMKRVFPNLKTVIGSYIFLFKDWFLDNEFIEFEFKDDLKYLVEKFDSKVRPKWTDKLQIRVDAEIKCDDGYRPTSRLMEKMDKRFKEFQEENKEKLLKSSLRKPPAAARFKDFPHIACFVLVEIETKDALIELSLETR